MSKKDLEFVKKYQKEIGLMSKSLALMQWDQETKMPEKGIETRAESSALLAGMVHEKIISDKFFNTAKKLQKSNLEGEDKLMISKLLKDLKKARTIPRDFVEELEQTTSKGTLAWKKARDKKDFEIFKPYLKKIVELKRKESAFYKIPGHPYNGLLDNYEEGMTSEILKQKFEELKQGLVSLLDKIQKTKKYKKQKLTLTKKKFSKQGQMEVVEDVVKKMGLQKDSSRVDFSEHPFTTTIGLNDVRITTNIREDPLFSFGSSVHEAGHALYELGMPQNHFYDSLGGAPSLGIHESQSRFWENMIGKGKPFWRYYFPIFSKKFKLGRNFEKWYDEVNFVTPGKVRVESDEVHYRLHVILRFEIELGLLDGTISVENLPKIWNQKMKEFFGVVPKDDKEGVLQDIHWPGGNFGYFPTYALGTIYASQIYKQLKKEKPEIEEKIVRGKFSEIRNWLRENIHKHGRKYLAEDLIKKVCGSGLEVNTYLNYLNEKYSKIYEFK